MFGKNGGDPMIRFGLSLLIAAYLVYLGFNLIRAPFSAEGTMGMPPWVAILFGILFIVAAGLVVFFRYQDYKRDKAEYEREAAEEEQQKPADEPQQPADEQQQLPADEKQQLPADEPKDDEQE